MGMGTTRDDGSQKSMWVATADLPQGAGYPLYKRLNQILEAVGFDTCVGRLCAPFYARVRQRSPVPPVVPPDHSTISGTRRLLTVKTH